MAKESEDGQEKSEEATGKRLDDAKEKGQIPRSRELSTSFGLIMGCSCLLVFGGFIGEKLENVFVRAFTPVRVEILSEKYMLDTLTEIADMVALVLLPIFVVMFLSSIFSTILVGGWVFSVEKLKFDVEKISILKGLKRLVSLTQLFEVVKSILKVALVLSFALTIMYGLFDQMVYLDRLPVNKAIVEGIYLVGYSTLFISCSLVIITAIDIPFQLWKFKEDMKMTMQEVKEEHKNVEGNPEVKQQLREAQQKISQQRMMADIPKADVVITNPTHFAVALKYQKSMNAPILVAKGVDLIASQIRSVATANQVSIVAAPALSRALFYTTELQQEIPAGLYTAVAQVLAYVFQMRMHRRGKAERPDPIGRVKVPRDFKY